jgi:hypothetical protein
MICPPKIHIVPLDIKDNSVLCVKLDTDKRVMASAAIALLALLYI